MEKDEHKQDFEKINQLWLNERTDKEDLKNKGIYIPINENPVFLVKHLQRSLMELTLIDNIHHRRVVTFLT